MSLCYSRSVCVRMLSVVGGWVTGWRELLQIECTDWLDSEIVTHTRYSMCKRRCWLEERESGREGCE